MLGIEKVDHIGIRVSDKAVSVAFYERLGFQTLSDTGFEKGHPIIMQHPRASCSTCSVPPTCRTTGTS